MFLDSQMFVSKILLMSTTVKKYQDMINVFKFIQTLIKIFCLTHLCIWYLIFDIVDLITLFDNYSNTVVSYLNI